LEGGGLAHGTSIVIKRLYNIWHRIVEPKEQVVTPQQAYKKCLAFMKSKARIQG
jgi:hypothetical protein